MSQNNVSTNLILTEMRKDNFSHFTTDCRDFVDTIEIYENLDKYARGKVSDIEIFPLVGVGDTLNANFPAHYDDVVNDTKENLQLGISFTDEDCFTYKLPLRETAKKSLLDRAKISGASLERLSRSQLSSVLNMCYKLYSNSSTLIYVNNDKVAAVLSGDSKDFSILPLRKLLESLHEKFDELSFRFQFVDGYLDHYYCLCKYEIVDGDLLDSYKKALDAHKIPYDARRMKAAVQFSSSNVGISTAKVSSFIKTDNHFLPLGTACSTPHRGGKTIDDFKESLKGMFGSYQEALVDLTRLMDIQLNHPVDVMTKICQKLKYPKAQSIEAIQLFESYAGNGTTAYDVYVALGEVLFNCSAANFEKAKTLIYAEDLPKVLGFSDKEWRKLDTPLQFSW
ncbi:MAG: hypothetical protein J1F23_06910 [Oscillospiraceae bacterium]|nr:hypothetical protein [Oscillospiraceae bacterium]